MSLFSRRPRDLTEIAAKEQRKESGLRARRRESMDAARLKYSRKALSRTAKTLGLENVRSLSPHQRPRADFYQGVDGDALVEGELLVAGQRVSLVLVAKGNIDRRPSVISGEYENRAIAVEVLNGDTSLGHAHYEWSSNFLTEREESYRLPGGNRLNTTKADFLAGIGAGLERIQVKVLEHAGISKPAPALSALDSSTSADPAATVAPSHDL